MRAAHSQNSDNMADSSYCFSIARPIPFRTSLQPKGVPTNLAQCSHGRVCR